MIDTQQLRRNILENDDVLVYERLPNSLYNSVSFDQFRAMSEDKANSVAEMNYVPSQHMEYPIQPPLQCQDKAPPDMKPMTINEAFDQLRDVVPR